jgi:dTDP-4-dehydrorhamnose reductase
MKFVGDLAASRAKSPRLELWGGVECTVNRLGDAYVDQLERTGHDKREGDLALLRELGLSALRYPILWERVAARSPDDLDWSWSDRRLGELRDLGIRPIAGLVHHGSGPAYTSLLDDAFAHKLATYAKAVATRYPWISDWTPVNEPLTTARFSCLYGHWYPHARDERLFWSALFNQIDGVRLAMEAIRQVVPKARLIQTEDLGLTYATAARAEQARHDNARRWMTWDLLAGKVVPGHALWNHLCGFGLEARLRVIAGAPCPPNVIGINHYLTSDRFLDHRLARYASGSHGGNARQRFADVEAIRALDPPPQGLRGAIDEAWERYRLPLALTEVHNGCSRDEQLRWFREAWRTCEEAIERGLDLRAVTSWALFGSSGWDTLLTGQGTYEPGAFDVRGGTPRPTALVRMLAALTGGTPAHPAADQAGWWRRGSRLRYAVAHNPAPLAKRALPEQVPSGAPVLVTGATGTLGQAMAAACRHRGLSYVLTDRASLDLLDARSIASALERHQPWAVINCSGWVRVDDAEDHEQACMAVNARGASLLAAACEERTIQTANFSTDLVFSGSKRVPYFEHDAVGPRNVYGTSKAHMERAVLALAGDHLIVRTAAFFSPFDHANFAVHLGRSLAAGQPFTAASDQVVTPTYVPDLCDATLDLLIDRERGLWHLSNQEALSWFEFGQRLAQALAFDASLLEGVCAHDMPSRAQWPDYSALGSERGALLPSLQSAIERFAGHFVTT